MTVKIVLEFSDADLDYYRKAMEATWQRNSGRAEKDLVETARRLLERVRGQEMAEYVRKRLDDLGTLIAMLEDPEWPLAPNDRARIVAALSYFAEPQDLIDDALPGLGFLDDALMAELLIRELKHELAAYKDLCKYRLSRETLHRGTHVSRSDWLAEKRKQLFYRMERRREERRRHYSTDEPTLPILRYEW